MKAVTSGLGLNPQGSDYNLEEYSPTNGKKKKNASPIVPTETVNKKSSRVTNVINPPQ